jgi:hypothetical protein
MSTLECYYHQRSNETVEKVHKQILGRDAEKSDFIECATINDLMLGKGQVPPENIVLTGQKDFSYRLVMSIINRDECVLNIVEILKVAPKMVVDS